MIGCQGRSRMLALGVLATLILAPGCAGDGNPEHHAQSRNATQHFIATQASKDSKYDQENGL